MSISGINASTASSIYSEIASQKASSTNAAEMTEQMEEVLESTEIDQETREAILEDLKAAIEELMANSDGEKPDPETMRETINTIFSEYGLDAEAIMSERFGGGLLSGESSSTTGTGSYQKSLFDYLGSDSDSNSLFDYLDSDSDDTSSSLFDQYAEQMSQKIMDLLMGIDEQA